MLSSSPPAIPDRQFPYSSPQSTPASLPHSHTNSSGSDWASVDGYGESQFTSAVPPASSASASSSSTTSGVPWPPSSAGSGQYITNGRGREASVDFRRNDHRAPSADSDPSVTSAPSSQGAALPPLPATSPLNFTSPGNIEAPSPQVYEPSPTTTPNLSSVGSDVGDGLGFSGLPESRSGTFAATTFASAPGPSGVPRRMSSSLQAPARLAEEADEVVPVGFDEGVLQSLCELDCGMPLLFDRMKQGLASSREASNFLKKRAIIEEDYARAMIKLARSTNESYSVSEGKAGSYVTSWQSLLRTHELLGDNRLKFATQLHDMSEELVTLAKEAEKTRKTNKDQGARLEKGLADQEALVDKAKARFDTSAEELERLLLVKQGESLKDPINMSGAYTSAGGAAGQKRTFGKAMSKLKGPKTSAQVAKQEEEVRSKMGQTSDSYRNQVLGAQAIRQEYFTGQLPKMLRSLKECVDEIDLATQYHLSRYSYLLESTLVNDGLTILPASPDDGPGLKAVVDHIDIREDFKTFMQQYALSWQMSGQRGPRRDGPGDEGFPPSSRPSMSPRPSVGNINQAFSAPTSHPTFGVDLGDQMIRDNVEVPRVLEKCCEAIELHGLDSMGIYRLSGTTSRVQRLKAKLDRDIEGTDLLSEENLTDINDTAAVMKLWFRELPEPLLTWELYHGFVEAAKIENDRLRHIRLHERVNDLPDPNYATLKFLMCHLHKVKEREAINQMSCSNLAIVFGPNLLGAPPGGDGNGTALSDMQWQSRAIDTILEKYAEIFEE